jgi:hypothetical protein
MTVRELIEKLQQIKDKNVDVFVWSEDSFMTTNFDVIENEEGSIDLDSK